MNSTVPGHFAPAAGIEVPLEMLSACHARIEQQCSTLRRLQSHLRGHGADEQARAAARSVMRYFDLAARQHHEDEEKDLFPALLESMAGSDPVCLRELTQSLTAEHRELEAAWQRIRAALERIEAGEAIELRPEHVDAFVDPYARHIEREEQELLPMAARLLSDDELGLIGRAMRKRRGISRIDEP